MRFLGQMKFLVLSMLFVAFAMGNTLTVKYMNSGGTAGDFNSVGDKVDGRDICAAVNDYNNNTPGCDMSGDVGYSDGGTGDPSDDSYTGDLIVRTNDVFTVGAIWHWDGTAGGAEEQATLTATLPAGTGFIWDQLPPPTTCKLPESSISADGKTMICLRKDFDTNNVGSYTETLELPVRVEGNAPNGSVPGDITVKLEAPNTITLTDGVQDGNVANLIKVTAAPRWNLQKSRYSTYNGKTNADGTKDGWFIYYKFYIEVDEVDNELDTFNNPSLGNEALAGGADATITFTDDLSTISPNAELVTWDNNPYFDPALNPCDMDTYASGGDPYPYLNATYPERSIPVPAGTMDVTCTAAGSVVTVTVDHIDATLTHAPKLNMGGGTLGVTKRIAAIGIMKVFVPYQDVEDAGGSLGTINDFTNFTPKGISGVDNFGGLHESEKDNRYVYTLNSSAGYGSKDFRKGWSEEADQIAEWGGGVWSSAPTDASHVHAGDGGIVGGIKFGTLIYYRNSGVVPLANVEVCDVIDIETTTMEVLAATDNAATYLDDSKHAVDLGWGTADASKPDLNITYAIGYVGTWPPVSNVAPGAQVGNECNDSSIVWYDDYNAAHTAALAAGTEVSKVKGSMVSLPAGEFIGMRIKLKARDTHLSDGSLIPKGELLVNYGAFKSPITDDSYPNHTYQPRDETRPHGGGLGDRLIFSRAKARVLKTMFPTSLTLGDESIVTLSPSFTIPGTNSMDGSLMITDVLPNGLGYVNGSTVGTYDLATPTNYGEPMIIANATDADCNTYAPSAVATNVPCGTLNGGTGKETLLVWDLGTQTTGTFYDDINFTVFVKIDAPTGTLKNYADIESDAENGTPAIKMANANVQVTVPSSLLISKEVLTPTHEINKGGLLNWMEFKVGARNGGGTDLTDVDIIDLLPFNGDGANASYTYTPQDGTTVDRKRDPATSYTGDFVFDSVSFDDNGVCNATNIEYWYTGTANPQDISPSSSTNTNLTTYNPESNWCQGDTTGPAGCGGLTNATITAVRARGILMPSGATCFMHTKFATQNNLDGDQYANTASINASGGGSHLPAVLSNTVVAKVYASSIGNRVWQDTDEDGVQDAGEVGVDGITVNLYDAANQLIATTTTAGGGLYNFPNLFSGDYTVEVVPGANLITTKSAPAGNPSIDSDFDENTNKTDTITLGQNDHNVNIDAGLIALNLNISGTVFDDGDGNANVNAYPGTISTPSTVQLHATLLDNHGAIVATTPIAANGTYTFGAADGVRPDSNYTVVLAITPNATVPSLPADNTWNNTGENNNAAAGNDGTVDGKIDVQVASIDVPLIDFGINHKPAATDKTEPSQLNPGGTGQAMVPTLVGADDESAILEYNITSLPTNATLYYADGTTLVQVGDIVNPAGLKIDPNDGALTATFNYTVKDEDGKISDAATVTMPFTPLTISGTVFDDGNGDGTVNGTVVPINALGLHATLVDDAGNIVATTPISATGTYEFTDGDGVLFDTNYTVVLATTASATVANLPIDWNNADGEHIGLNAGLDGAADGSIAVNVLQANIPNINFGINNRPVANDVTDDSHLNPGDALRVQVVDINTSDLENALSGTVCIKTLPTNGTLYYNDIAIGTGCINGFSPALFEVDPADGEPTVVFDYSVIDAGGLESPDATITIPFTGLTIRGNVFDDGNGDGTVNGTTISSPSGTQLHATLLDNAGVAMATMPITAGSYSFGVSDGVEPNKTYTIVLATSANATVANLPTDWNNADGEHIGLNAGLDGAADGSIAVNVLEANIDDINFGINYRPVANNVIDTPTLNPGDALRVQVVDLNMSDQENALSGTVCIKTLPTSGTLYYNGTAIATGCINGFSPALFEVDPADGEPTVIFEYSVTDAGGLESPNATVTMPFVGLRISGNIYDDGNHDGTVNGDVIGEASGTQLYVTLLDEHGAVVASTAVSATGTYSFVADDGVEPNKTYSIVLATSANATVASLPANWNNADGEHIGLNAGLDGAADGVIVEENIENINFGINHAPVAGDRTDPARSNPSGDTKYLVPALPVTDTEDGTPTTITIKSLPDLATGILYYDGHEVAVDEVITNYDPSLMMVDPTEGNPEMVFTYTTTDAANVESPLATVTMPFLGDMFVGDKVWMDTNGNGIQDTDEEPVSGVAVKLFSEDGTLIGTTETNSTGEYSFKVAEPGNYYVEFGDGTTYFTQSCSTGMSTLVAPAAATCSPESDSDVTGTSYRTATFALDYGQTDLSHDAGIAPTAHLGDYVWIDTDADGIQDENEEPIPGTIVELFDAEGNPAEDVHGNHRIVAGPDGNYSFDVVPGDYTVKFTLPEGYDGYVFSNADQGDNDDKDSDANTQGFTQAVSVSAGEQHLSLDAGLNCGCSDVVSDSADALGTLSVLLMLLLTLTSGLLFVRREEYAKVSQ